MPYIKREDREEIDDRLRVPTLRTPGELNYVLTMVCRDYWLETAQNYQALNDIIGALEGAKLELYRRLVAPYEDRKIAENGDVW